VSVVIPTLDAERTLGAQLDALSTQDYRGAWEVVIVDNGSSDDSMEVAKAFSTRLPLLRLAEARDQRSAAHARNVGVSVAGGDFIAFCDAVGLSPELPVPAETAACFLAYLADAGRVDRTTGECTGTSDPLRHGYLRQAIAAIGYRHELNGLPAPLGDPLVQAVLRGYGRIHGTDVRGKDPIRLDGLTRIATTLTRPATNATRDRALVLLLTHPDLQLNAGQLARLDGYGVVDDRGLFGGVVHGRRDAVEIGHRKVRDHDVG